PRGGLIMGLQELLELYLVGNLSSVEKEIRKGSGEISIHDLLDYYAETEPSIEDLVLFVKRMYDNY
ncbi:hypothetical protein KA005_14720, partial [bacterium]|nr:hypothetical protein [bacterium]